MVDAGERRDAVTLEDRHGKRRVFTMLPAAFLVDGRPVTLVRPAATRRPHRARPARTASGSIAVAAAPARVARASRIWVEGVHDAALVERIWGDDLRVEGVVVEPLGGIDDLAAHVREFRPGPQRRVGVLVDHLVAGSKESRIVADLARAGSATRAGHRPPLRRRVAGGEADRARHRRVADDPARHRLEDRHLRRARGQRPARDVAARPGRREQLRRRRGAAAARRRGADRLRHRRLIGDRCHDGVMPEWLVWLIVAGVLAGGEAVSGTFVLIMMAGGALRRRRRGRRRRPGARCRSSSRLVLTVGLLWLVRPVAMRHLNPGPAAITGSDALVGKEAIVLAEVTRDGGRVRLNGSEWSARAKDPNRSCLPAPRVSVVAIEGATAVVWQDPFA